MTSKTLVAGGTGNAPDKRSNIKFGKDFRKEFFFEPEFRNFNHGSFGTYPRALQPTLRGFQDAAETRPDSFIRYKFPLLLDEAREAMSKLLRAPVESLVFVPNATNAVNTVFRNLTYEPGDKIVFFDYVYGTCEKTIAYITETTPAESVKIPFQLPFEDDWLVEEFKKTIKREQENGSRVRIALFDTIVSLPGVRLPFERLTEACRELGVLSCIDGAHSAGHLDLDLGKLNPDFYFSNCHKWLYAPRGCAIFHVPVRNQHLIRSSIPTSHGFVPYPKPGVKITNPLPAVGNKSPWVVNFEFVGTIDNAPYLCIPEAIKYRESIGGEKAILGYCYKLSQEGAARTAEILGTEVLDNSTRTLTNCCLSNVRLPLQYSEIEALAVQSGMEKDDVAIAVRNWMSKTLVDDYDTFMALCFFQGNWWVRWSAQIYLDVDDYEWGAQTLKSLCERVKKGEFAAPASKL